MSRYSIWPAVLVSSTTTLLATSIMSAAAAAQTPSDSASSVIDEIVVTARKREERLQDIPVAASAISSEEIADLGGLTNNAQIGALLTGVSVDTDGIPEFFIRGAGVGRVPTTDSATTQLRNGAETAGGFGGRSYTKIDLFDLAQVEVYRGPQGALYGRNAVGGVVNIVSQAPKPDFGYSLLASSDFTRDSQRAEAIINVPVVADRLFVRAGFQYEEEDGLYYNEYLNERFQGNKQLGARLGVRALITENVDTTLFLDYADNEVDQLSSRDLSYDPVDYTGLGVVDPDGAPVSGLRYFPLSGDALKQAFDTRGLLSDELLNANWTINVDTPAGVLQSITQFRKREFEHFTDADASYVGGPLVVGAPCGTTRTTTQCEDFRPSDTEIFTQELRLLSSDGAAFNWLVGTDYRHLTNTFDIERTGRLLAANRFLVRNSLLATRSKSYQIGVFANAGVEILEDLVASAGARYSREVKEFQSHRVNLDLGRAAYGQVVGAQNDGDVTFDTVDPSASLTYNLGGGLIYASYARAHRSGGFNQDDPSFAGLGSLTFDTERARSYEVGAKHSFFGGALDLSVAGFRVDYTDLLYNDVIQANDPRGAGFQIQFVANGGDARVQGGEADLTFRLPDVPGTGGTMIFRGGVAYTDTEFTATTARSGVAVGSEISQTPRWNHHGDLTFRRSMLGSLGLFINTSYSRESGGVDSVPRQTPRDTFFLWNGQLGLEGGSSERSWTITAFVNNISDYISDARRGVDSSPQTDPRTWGVRFTMRGN